MWIIHDWHCIRTSCRADFLVIAVYPLSSPEPADALDHCKCNPSSWGSAASRGARAQRVPHASCCHCRRSSGSGTTSHCRCRCLRRLSSTSSSCHSRTKWQLMARQACRTAALPAWRAGCFRACQKPAAPGPLVCSSHPSPLDRQNSRWQNVNQICHQTSDSHGTRSVNTLKSTVPQTDLLAR